MKIIDGGVCAAKGFKAGSVRCGIKASRTNDDTAIIFSECECNAAATYTMNRVKAAPVYVTMEHLEDGVARAIVANSGNANACAPDGMENARRMAKAAANFLGVDEEDVAVASTGVIGQRINIECIEEHLSEIVLSDDASEQANRAIMTTDTRTKTAAVEFTVGGKTCRIGGICKGSGMIHPNMGTMLSFITTDCAISHEMLTDALQENVKKTYNRVTVDGDTSTNDMCVVLANGLAGNEPIDWQNEDYQAFCKALNEINTRLARQIAADGEGATKLVTVYVRDAASEADADKAARTIANSPLVKTAIAGRDCNWGRIAAALGRSGARFDQYAVDIDIMGMPVLRAGLPCGFDEDEAPRRFEADEIVIEVSLGTDGDAATRVWTCDLTHEYIHINADYRS